jgi:hypothetical protein
MERRTNLVLSDMKNIKLYLLLLLSLLGAGDLLAQRGGGGGRPVDPERLQAARIAFITARISLKAEQAERFWPLFNSFTESRESNMKAIAELSRGTDSMNEEDAKGRLQQKLQLQQKLVDDEKIFVAAAAKVVTYRQLLQLQNIAKDFNRYFYERQRGNQ